MQEKRKLIWSPHYYNFDEKKRAFSLNKDDKEEDSTYQDDFNDDEEDIGQLIQTPFGLFNVDDEMNPYKQFRFWMGMTNFNISNSVANTIKTIAGVEVFHILTRYRFIIAIAPTFNSLSVKENIQNMLCKTAEVPSVNENNVIKVLEEVKKYKNWSIYVFPNGTFDVAFLKEDNSNLDEFQQAIGLHEEAQQLSEGKWIKSESERETSDRIV